MEYSNYFGRYKIYINDNLINSENLLFLSTGIEKYITITNFYKQNNFIRAGDNLKIEKHFYNVYPGEIKENKKEIYNCNILKVNGKDILTINFKINNIEEKKINTDEYIYENLYMIGVK